jgi:hypothetical protein
MKLPFLILLSCVLPLSALAADDRDPAAGRLASDLFEWSKLEVTPTATGERRAVFDGPTATVDKIHCHSSTLKPGEKSGDPRKHLQEEVIIVKEGRVEANWDGHSKVGGPGSVIFLRPAPRLFCATPEQNRAPTS